jgi:hypothetical protein
MTALRHFGACHLDLPWDEFVSIATGNARLSNISREKNLEECTALIDEYIRNGGNLNKRIFEKYLECSLVGNEGCSSLMRRAIHSHSSVDLMKIAIVTKRIELVSAFHCILKDNQIVTSSWLEMIPLSFYFAKPEETFKSSDPQDKFNHIYKAESIFESLINGRFEGLSSVRDLLWQRLLGENDWQQMRSNWVTSTLQAEWGWDYLNFYFSSLVLRNLSTVLHHAYALDDRFYQWYNGVKDILSYFCLPDLTELVRSYLETSEFFAPRLLGLIERRIEDLLGRDRELIVKRRPEAGRYFTIHRSPSANRITVITGHCQPEKNTW